MEAMVDEIQRKLAESNDIHTLADIYKDDVNIAVWKRDLSSGLRDSIASLLDQAEFIRVEDDVTPENVKDRLNLKLDHYENVAPLVDDLSHVVDMFCCLFEQTRVGLRLTKLDRAMCPRFHTDKVPCRLVTTYQGLATEWLKHDDVDRSKLGAGNNGLSDSESGIYSSRQDIRSLTVGDIALLKGDKWIGNEGAGLVHRSPNVGVNEKRLLLTLDFIG
ncbi:MAG: DUF1826 domain-containing protein [Oleiphilaceae bacterium]|nr:DUF1826 domain-containing protein [Oleiphilaceae bacterium]